MCWNKEVSIISFSLISLVCYSLYQRNLPNDRLMSIFIMCYGTVQLFEFFIWIGIENNNIMLNKIFSILINILLFTLPLGIMIGLKNDIFYKNEFNKFKIFDILALLVVIICILVIIFHKIKNNYTFTSYLGNKSSHLVWDFPHSLYILVILFVLIITLLYIYPKNKIFSLFLMLYFLIPVILFFVYKKKMYGFSSYWCWVVAICAFLIYLVNPYLQKYNIKN